MSSHIYEFLSGFGYNHPLHPAFTHLPVGLTIGSFIFIAVASTLLTTGYRNRLFWWRTCLWEKMPVSGWPVSAEGLRRQLKSPYSKMPSFGNLAEEEIESLTGYLQSL